MKWSDFSGKKVGLLGAGSENLGLISHLLKAGAQVAVRDRLGKDPSRIPSGVEIIAGPRYLKGIGEYDYVFRSPGLPVWMVDRALASSKRRPIRTSAMDLFLSLRLCQTVGVTGTKGKGTTATMIDGILRAEGRQVILAGNIGSVVYDRLEEITPDTIVVLELSSFQLEDVTASPNIAVVVPVTSDHLRRLSDESPNRHESVAAYIEAKANIAAFQRREDLMIYASDTKNTRIIADRSPARHYSVGAGKADLRVSPGGRVSVDGEPATNLVDLGLRGEHYFLDAGLAIAAARALGCGHPAVEEGLRGFRPLLHRLPLEPNVTVQGVGYIDDSYATSPDAAECAIRAYGDRPLVWIGGGSRKGASFKRLAATIARSTIKAVVLLGQESGRLAEAIRDQSPNMPISTLATSEETTELWPVGDAAAAMVEVTALAHVYAVKGDGVLLSPGCASKDMFTNAAQRGELFLEAARQIE